MTSLHYFPGTDCHLKNGYDVFVLACLERSRRVDELNLTVQSLFSLRWTGNIIVVKRGFRDRGCALSITPPEVSLINSLVERCVPCSALLRQVIHMHITQVAADGVVRDPGPPLNYLSHAIK